MGAQGGPASQSSLSSLRAQQDVQEGERGDSHDIPRRPLPYPDHLADTTPCSVWPSWAPTLLPASPWTLHTHLTCCLSVQDMPCPLASPSLFSFSFFLPCLGITSPGWSPGEQKASRYSPSAHSCVSSPMSPDPRPVGCAENAPARKGHSMCLWGNKDRETRDNLGTAQVLCG